MSEHIFVGFGFGPIQSGLFVKEAFQSGNFRRIVVAEIDQKLVDAVRENNGSYFVNVATFNGVEILKIDNVEIYNPNVEKDRGSILAALEQATEITTSLPSVKFYDIGQNSVVSLIAEGLKNSRADATIIYTAENNNHAAEILEEAVVKKTGNLLAGKVRFLNTVIGKMSGVITDADEIKNLKIKPIAEGLDRAFLVEEFNKILVTRTKISGFQPGIEVFIEKEDLLVFEEAKLYGHNAIHTLLAYLGDLKGYTKMTELKDDAAIMKIGSDAFINESGAALIKKYAKLNDELFTEAGYRDFAEDLLERMTNPYLTDTVARAGRDPVRKLGPNDRIFGTMALALEFGIEPVNMALGAMAGIAALGKAAKENDLPEHLCFGDWRRLEDSRIEKILDWLWGSQRPHRSQKLIKLVQNSRDTLIAFENK